MMKKIERALISVSDKSGIVPLATALASTGTEIVSTGGTAALLESKGISVTRIDSVTGFPEMLGGRVRTLHPRVFGGILGRRAIESDVAEMREHQIPPIDLVVVSFYPFSETAAREGATESDIIEKIDIGGPALLRAAAKSFADVAILHHPDQYDPFLEALRSDAGVTLKYRRTLTRSAFQEVARYDEAIRDWFGGPESESETNSNAQITISAARQQKLRYGENPHQKAAWYTTEEQSLRFTALQGKELSYNNLLDADAAWRLIEEFDDPAVAIIKHGNPCGVATGGDLSGCFRRALAGDSISAFGGIVAVNREVDGPLAEELASLFIEVVIAERFSNGSRERLARKKRVRLVEVDRIAGHAQNREIRSTAAGLLVQDRDEAGASEDEWRVVTKRIPTEQEMADLRFAWKVAKHVRSNAIVLARDGAMIGVGAGQMSRIDSVRFAVEKAVAMNHDVRGSALASDGFFPFPDGVQNGAEAGAAAIIQPGGSIRDDEVIAEADRLGIAMILTGRRHFRH